MNSWKLFMQGGLKKLCRFLYNPSWQMMRRTLRRWKLRLKSLLSHRSHLLMLVNRSSVQRNWAEAFEEETAVFNPSCSDNVVVRTVRTPAVNQNRSPVATREQIVENSQDASTPMLLIKFQSTAKKPSVRADKGKKIVPSVADASYRRVTRSVTSNKGYRAPPIQELLPRPHKRSRKVVPVESLALDNSQAQDKGKKTKSKQRMANQSIPVQVLQHIGGLLDMQPEDITEAKLNAEPSKTSSASVPDV